MGKHRGYLEAALTLSMPEMRDDLLGDGLDVPGPVLLGTRNAEDNVPRPRVYILLKPADTLLHRSQHTVIPDDVDEVARLMASAGKRRD